MGQTPPSTEPPTVAPKGSVEAQILGRQPTEEELENDVNNVANFIDIKKVVGKNESNYYYTPKNRTTREKIEKIKRSKKGRSKEVDNLDTSQHTRKSLLSGCKSKSSYFGPTPMLKNGSPVEGILKDQAYYIRRSSLLSGISDGGSGHSKTRDADRHVVFTSVVIREHERIAGDNPCVTSGVPLSIGWASFQREPIPLDDYETARGEPRDKVEMMVPADVRRAMLRDEFKVSINDLNTAMKSVNIAKKQRAATVATEHLEGWHELSQSAKRKFNRFMNKSSTKKEEAALWEEAHNAATQAFMKNFSVDAVGAKQH